jgi:transcriptional regulator with XRE-family HTH domain
MPRSVAKQSRLRSARPVSAAAPPDLTEHAPRIGAHLRRARRLKSMRLKDVAEACGVSVSFISKIENNRAVPSLSTLHQMAKVLGTSVSALFSIEERVKKVVHRPADRPVAGRVQNMVEWDGIQAEIIVPYAEGRLLEGFVFVMEPGGHSGGVLRHDGEECGYVIEGDLELIVGNEKHQLTEGDSFFFRSDIPHAYRNPSKKITRVIWINTPPTF